MTQEFQYRCMSGGGITSEVRTFTVLVLWMAGNWTRQRWGNPSGTIFI